MRIFYQSPVAYDWIRQRPHFISEGLAALGHYVFWFYAAPFHRCRFRRWDNGSGMIGLELPVLPFATRFRLFEWINKIWVSWWLRRVKVDVVIATHPVVLPWLPRQLCGTPHVYDCMDIQTAFFKGRRRTRMAEEERRLVAKAYAIVASSDVILDKLRNDYLSNAVSFAVVPNGIKLSVQEASSMPARVEHPSIAYFGTIASWFDWEAVLHAAESHPQWCFDLFGPCEGKVPTLPKNVVLRGVIPQDLILAQARESDVLIMPFVRNELIEGVDPVKMYEYLRIGRPIVSSWWPLLEKFGRFDAVRFYGGEVSFSDCIAAALDGPCEFPAPEMFLKECSWETRVGALETVIKQGLKWKGVCND